MKDYISVTDEKVNFTLHKSVFESIVKEVLSDEETFQLKDIDTKLVDNNLELYINVKAKRSSNIGSKCLSLQDNIYKLISNLCNVECKSVNINIVGFVF